MGGIGLKQHPSLLFTLPTLSTAVETGTIFPVAACTPRFPPSDMSVLWAQALSDGSFTSSFTTTELSGGFCHFYQGQNHPVAEKEGSF